MSLHNKSLTNPFHRKNFPLPIYYLTTLANSLPSVPSPLPSITSSLLPISGTTRAASAGPPPMPSSSRCNVCRCPGGECSHTTDHNRALPVFDVEPVRGTTTHEFQFFGHDETVAWIFNDPPSPEEGAAASVAAAGLKYLDNLREASDPDVDPGDGTTTFGTTACLSRRSTISRPVPEPNNPVSAAAVALGQAVPPTANYSAITSSSLSVSRLRGASGENSNEITAEGQLEGGECYPSIEREAKITRYREKRKRRKYENQIRYASRKAYAPAED